MDSDKNNQREKWYNTAIIVDSLLFLFPPLGFFALFKSDKLVPKAGKIIIGVAFFIGAVCGLATVLNS